MDVKELISVTLILFSVIDILGNIPVVISLKQQGNKIHSGKATLASAVIMILFLIVGENMLKLFGVDIQSFAIAGAIVIFLIGLEMILGRDIFKSSPNINSVSVFPLAFPLIAGAGTLTTILTLKAEYQGINIIGGIIINLIIIYAVLKSSGWIQRKIGSQGVEILRKVFGIILLAIAIKIAKENILFIFNHG